MSGVFFIFVGVLIFMLGLSIDEFENNEVAKKTRKGIFLSGLFVCFAGILLLFFGI